MTYQRRGDRADHYGTARSLKEQPNVWLLVSEYRSRNSALTTARSIETGDGLTAYRPAESFEARTEMTEDGTAVLARYIGRQS